MRMQIELCTAGGKPSCGAAAYGIDFADQGAADGLPFFVCTYWQGFCSRKNYLYCSYGRLLAALSYTNAV